MSDWLVLDDNIWVKLVVGYDSLHIVRFKTIAVKTLRCSMNEY